jgi:hypothetical protein
MYCLFNHRWKYDFRLHHIYRKCQFCDVAQRHLRNKESVYTAWEPVSERSYIESEQRQIVQKRSSMLVRLAQSLGLLRTKTSDGTRSLA